LPGVKILTVTDHAASDQEPAIVIATVGGRLASYRCQNIHHGLDGIMLGRGLAVGRGLGVGVCLGVTVAVAVGVAVGGMVAVAVGVDVAVAVGVGV
jgi:hypothetical protein